jgi:hypothetical protein
MEPEPKATIQNGEYVLSAKAFANGGTVDGSGQPVIDTSGCELLIPLDCPYCSRPEGHDACPIHTTHD